MEWEPDSDTADYVVACPKIRMRRARGRALMVSVAHRLADGRRSVLPWLARARGGHAGHGPGVRATVCPGPPGRLHTITEGELLFKYYAFRSVR